MARTCSICAGSSSWFYSLDRLAEILLRIETEPVHFTLITCMFDLDALIDNTLNAAAFGDGYPFRADHAEL